MKILFQITEWTSLFSSFRLMRNIQGPEVLLALPILTILIESQSSWELFLCFFTSAEPTTRRIPVLPRTPILSKLIWKNGCSFLYSSEVWIIVGWSDAANFNFKACPELAAGEYRISSKLKLPHLASILDGHFVAGYRIWEGLGSIESRWFWRPSNFESRWF